MLYTDILCSVLLYSVAKFWSALFCTIILLCYVLLSSATAYLVPVRSVIFCFLLTTQLYCVLLYCVILYCALLYCVLLYCVLLYCVLLYCALLYCVLLYCVLLYCALLYCVLLYSQCPGTLLVSF